MWHTFTISVSCLVKWITFAVLFTRTPFSLNDCPSSADINKFRFYANELQFRHDNWISYEKRSISTYCSWLLWRTVPGNCRTSVTLLAHMHLVINRYHQRHLRLHCDKLFYLILLMIINAYTVYPQRPTRYSANNGGKRVAALSWRARDIDLYFTRTAGICAFIAHEFSTC